MRFGSLAPNRAPRSRRNECYPRFVSLARSIWITLIAAGCGRLGFDPTTAPSEYVAVVLADQPISHYRFGEQAGSLAKDETGARLGRYAAGVVLGVSGAIANDDDTAVALDGERGRIDFGDEYGFANRAPFTIEVWVKPDVIGPDVRFVLARGGATGGGRGYHIYFNDGAPAWTLFTRTDGAVTAYTDAGGLSTSRFDHLVATYDGAISRVYRNGALVDQASSTTDITLSGAGAFVLGDSEDGIYYKFKGAFDELAIYDRALVADRIQAHYAIGVGE